MNMKKLGTKTAAAVLTAAAAASIAAFSVSAADYGQDPQYPVPNTNSYSTFSASPVTNTSNAAPASADDKKANADEKKSDSASILTSDTVSGAITSALGSGSVEAVVKMSEDKSGNVTLLEDTLAAIANSNVNVTVDVTPSSKNELAYSVTISPNNISGIDGSLNIGLSITKTTKMSSVEGIKVPTGAVVIKPHATGDLGATLRVTLPKSALKGMKKSKVHLYAVSADGRVIKLSDDAISVNADGSVTILVDTGDLELVISDKDIVKAAQKHGTSRAARSSSAPVSAKSAAVFGMIDISAVSAAAIISKKKKKK